MLAIYASCETCSQIYNLLLHAPIAYNSQDYIAHNSHDCWLPIYITYISLNMSQPNELPPTTAATTTRGGGPRTSEDHGDGCFLKLLIHIHHQNICSTLVQGLKLDSRWCKLGEVLDQKCFILWMVQPLWGFNPSSRYLGGKNTGIRRVSLPLWTWEYLGLSKESGTNGTDQTKRTFYPSYSDGPMISKSWDVSFRADGFETKTHPSYIPKRRISG